METQGFFSFLFFFFFFLQNTKTAFGFYQTFGQTLCSSEYNLAATCNIFERVKMCFGCCSILSRFFLAPAARRSFGGFIKLLGKIGLEGEVVTSYTRHALPIRKQTNRQTVSSTWTTRLCLPRYTCIHFNKVFSYLLDFTLPVSSHCWLCGNFCLPSRAPLPTIRKRGYEKCPVKRNRSLLLDIFEQRSPPENARQNTKTTHHNKNTVAKSWCCVRRCFRRGVFLVNYACVRESASNLTQTRQL